MKHKMFIQVIQVPVVFEANSNSHLIHYLLQVVDLLSSGLLVLIVAVWLCLGIERAVIDKSSHTSRSCCQNDHADP